MNNTKTCAYCGAEMGDASVHAEESCVFNPETKACATCEHYRPTSDSCFIKLYGEDLFKQGECGLYKERVVDEDYENDPMTIDANDMHNALINWLLDTDSDSVAEVAGPIFGVAMQANVKSDSFAVKPIAGQYMNGLEQFREGD